jgi:rhodanese-related sulfurtransferase
MYCRSGVRSATAIELARKKGYKLSVVGETMRRPPLGPLLVTWRELTTDGLCSIRNFPGSYLEWVSKQNERRADDDFE